MCDNIYKLINKYLRMSKLKTVIGTIKNFENWPTFFADHFNLIKKDKIILKLRNGVKYIARTGTVDKNIINETWLHKVYTPDGFKINEGDTVIDIGAHIGAFSLFASKYAKKGKVFSFEPVPDNFEILAENIALNTADNVIAVNKAVSDKNGKQKIFLNNKNTGRHSLYSQRADAGAINIDVISLDNFISKNKIKSIDFLKMDCEGSEYPILFNSSKNTLKKINKISMEYHNLDEKNNGRVLKEFLEKNGFKVMMRGGKYSLLYAIR